MENVREIDFSAEWVFQLSRSSGKGGQNVNKVESKVELIFNVNNSSLLTDEQKALISGKLAGRINSESELRITCEEGRSQLANKKTAIEKFYDIIEKALKKPKPRRKTRPTLASKERRLKEKKINAAKKDNRRGMDE